MDHSIFLTKDTHSRFVLSLKTECSTLYTFFLLGRYIELNDFLDIGANAGLYSAFMADSNKFKNIYSFEPSPGSYALLSDMRQRNKFACIQLFNFGLSSKNDVLSFLIASEYSGINSILDTTIHDRALFKREERISVKTLDSLNLKFSGSLMLKIDVEGHEYDVIKGAINTLTSNKVLVQCEIARVSIDKMRLLFSELKFDYLFGIGNDHFFSNHPSLKSKDAIISILSKALRVSSDEANKFQKRLVLV